MGEYEYFVKTLAQNLYTVYYCGAKGHFNNKKRSMIKYFSNMTLLILGT